MGIFLIRKHCCLLDVVYFTDWRQGGIVAVQRSDPSTATIMRKGVDKMYSIRVYDQDEQPVSGKYGELSGINHSIKALHPRLKACGLVCSHVQFAINLDLSWDVVLS